MTTQTVRALGPVVITGVSGFLGRHLAVALVRDGVEVRGFSRDPAALSRTVPGLGRVSAWTREGRLPLEALDGAHAVVHLAGENVGNAPWTAARKREIEASRSAGTRRLVEAIAALPPERRPRVLVSASAVGFYGDGGERALDESSPRGEGFLAEVCEAWERAACEAEALGVRVVRVRIGLVMGREGGALAKLLPLFRVGLGGRVGSGAQFWPWIHIVDLVGLVRFAIARDDVAGPLDATAPEPVRQAEFARVLGAALRRPAFVPAPVFALRGLLGEFSDELLGSRCVRPTRALELGYAFRFPVLAGALEDLLRAA